MIHAEYHNAAVAVQLLGISMAPKEIEAVLHEVDRSGTGELEMDDFTQLMVLTLSRTAAQAGEHAKGQDKQQAGKSMQQASLPFEVVALAYRRSAMQAEYHSLSPEWPCQCEREYTDSATPLLLLPDRTVAIALLNSVRMSLLRAGKS